MPFSYDINADDANRIRRRSQRTEKQDNDRIEYKALGANLGQLARGAVAFDPNAEDGDGDGLVQDNTPYERPAVLSNIAETMRQGLASTTGYNSVFTNGHSPTKGMTNREVAEYAVPDNPTRFLEMRLQQQALMRLSNSNPYIQDDLEKVSFDPEGIEQLRNLVERTLDERPALRVAWDRFGVPPIGISAGKNRYSGVFLGDSILMDDDNLKVKPVRSKISNARIMNLLTSAALGAPNIKGIKRPFVSAEPRDTLTHEWGHYLHSLTQVLHPDAEVREAAKLLDAQWWDNGYYYKDQLARHPKIKRLFDYFASVQSGDSKEAPDDSIPFVSSAYATTQPSEFVAEMISAYFSPDKKTRALLNDAGAQLVEEVFLGIGRSGLASSSVRRSTTGSSMRGLTPAEMAERIVPSTLEEALVSMADHQKMMALDDNSIDVDPGALKTVIPKGIDDLDFSPEAVKEMREVVTQALANNRMFREVAERHGFPPVLATKRDAEWVDGDETYAVSMIEGFPSIIVNREVRNTLLGKEGAPNEMYPGEGALKGTDRFLVSSTEDAMMAHEWGHYINRLALASHPDPEVRALAAFWFSDTWDHDAELTGVWKALDKMGVNVGADKVSQRILGARKFGDKVKNNKSERWTGYPHAMSQYGQTMPAETFAEGVAAILVDDENLRDMVSPALRDDIFDIIGKPEVYERDIANGVKASRAGLASFSIPRDNNGDILIPNTATSPGADKTPLGGRDWLKDATNDEIADTLSPRSIDDFVSLTLMNMVYGKDPSGLSTYTGQLVNAIVNSFFPETRGAPGHFIDFTPQGVDRTRDIIKSALDASPEFAWIMRTFGSVPIVSIDPDDIDRIRLQEMLTGTQIASDEAKSAGIMGWSLGMFGIVLNTSSKPGRKRTPIGQRKRLSDYTYNEDLTLEEFLINTDMSMEGTLYHEWFHSFFSRALGWHSAVGASGLSLPGERADRQDYLYPGVANVDRITKLMKDSFDADGFIPYSSLDPMLITPVISKARRKIQRNNDSDRDFLAIMANHDSQLDSQGLLWTPDISRRTLDEIRARYPYLVDDLAPMLNVTYGTASRQEQFAEGGVLFVTPDKKERSAFLPSELESMYAYILGLKSDPSPGDYDKPWLERSGLASRYASEQRSINTVGERVHTGKEIFVQAGASQGRPDPIKSSMGMIDVSINGYDFSIAGGLPEFQEAYGAWNDWQENWRMRYISSEILGLNALSPQADTRPWQSITNNHLKNGTINDASDSTREDIQRSTMMSLSLMKEIARNNQSSNASLYRSINNVGENDAIARLNVGETLSMPLTSFSPDYNSVLDFSKNSDQTSIGDAIRDTGNVVIKLRAGASVVNSPVKKRTTNDDGREVNTPIESITAGEFIVKSKNNVNGVDVVELEQSRVIDPLPGLSSESLTGDIVDDYAMVKRSRINREKIDSIPEIREYAKRLDSLRTPKERKDRIMALIESIAIRDFNEQFVEEALDDIAKDIRRMVRSGLFNKGDEELRPSDAQNYWYIADLTDKVAEVLKRSIYRDVEDRDSSEELANLVDEWQMEFRVDDPSGGPSNMFEEFGLASTSNLTPEQRSVYTSIQEQISGLASRGTPTNPIGKNTEEIAREIELSPEEMKILEGLIPNADKIADIDVNPALKDYADELLGSVRVTVGDDGIPFIYASPHPFLSEEIPDKRNWSAVVRPSKETLGKVKELIDNLVKKSMGEDTPEEFWARSTGDGDKTEITEAFREETKKLRTSFTTWAKELLDNVTSTKQDTPSRGEFRLPDSQGQPTWLGMWAESLRNLESPSVLTFFGDNELTSHDVWGHLGTGRGFDRHGEWANMLAMFSLMDRWAEEKGISKEELLKLKASWFQTFEFGRVDGEFKPPAEQIRAEDKWYIKQWAIDSAFDFADTAELEELISLIDDGNTHTGASKGLASTSGSELSEIAKIDIVRQSVKKSETRNGLASTVKNPLSYTKESYVQSLDEDIASRKEYISNLEKALEEWNDTGIWRGADYGVAVNPDVKPGNITREGMLESNYNPDDFAGAVKKRLDSLNSQLDVVTKSRERAEKQPETTTQIEAILGDPETLARIEKRAQELRDTPRPERAEFFQDGDYRYVVHWGADTLDGGVLDPSRSRGDENSQAVAGNTRRINKVTAMQLVAVRDDQKQKLEDLTNIQKEFEETGLVNFSAAKNPMGVERMIGYLISRGNKRNAQYHGDMAYRPFPDEADLKELGIDELTPEMKEEIALIIERSRNGAELRLQSLDAVADKLIADDYQYSSTYPAEDIITANGYGGRYGEDGDSWGNDRPLANRAGIHVFRVRMGQDATTETGGPGEIHIIGQHTPIASLSIETHRNAGPQPTSAQYTWQGWLAEVVEADKKSRAGLASRGTPVSPAGKSIEDIAKEIELTPKEVKILSEVLPDVSLMESMEINPSLKDKKEELINSVRVTVGEDGIPFVYAAPNPILSNEIPDKRDWSAVVRPRKETAEKVREVVEELANSAIEGTTAEGLTDILYTENTPQRDKMMREVAHSQLLRFTFADWSNKLIKKIADEHPFDSDSNKLITGMSNPYEGPMFLEMWAQGLQDIKAPLSVFKGDIQETNGMHDMWGHVGIGRGFDRHGEWANMFAMFSLMDRWAEENDISEDDLTITKASWFQWLEFNKINGEFKPSGKVLSERGDARSQQMMYDYALSTASTEKLRELLSIIDDGNTHNTGESMGLASASSRDKAEIVKTDIVRQTVVYDLESSGLASGGSPADSLRSRIMMRTGRLRRDDNGQTTATRTDMPTITEMPRPTIPMRNTRSYNQLQPTNDIEEAKRTGRPLSILLPGTMLPKTQSAHDEIIDTIERNLQEALDLKKRYQEIWDRNPTPPYSDEEKDAIQAKNKIRNELLQPALNAAFENLNRALLEEYKPLGFNEEDLDIVKQGIFNHLKEKSSYSYGIYGQPELWSDEARLQHSVEALDEADIAIAFPKDLLEQLIQDGRFKTQFETKSSRGSLHPAGRKQTDVAQFGYHPDTAPEMRPVFGYLTKGGVIDKSTLGSIKQYGELQFILKRDTHSRSTYTTHDSLSTGLTPSPMGVPSKDASGKVGETMYAEAQIHGGLTLGDVDYVVINVGEPDQWDWQNNKVAQEEFESISGMLATIGIRVVPVRDGEVVDTWNGGKTTPEQPVEVVAQSQEPVKVVA